MLDLGDVQLHYRIDGNPDGAPVVFANSLGTDLRLWDKVLPLLPQNLRYIRYDKRGHGLSSVPAAPYSMGALVRDAERLLDHLEVRDCVFVGLSIGGLYAANAYLRGADAAGIVFINSLRMDGLHLSWVNDATARLAKTGGGQLVMDAMMPHIAGPAFLERMRPNALGDAPYEAMDETSGIYQLMDGARSATWDIAYENIKCPVLNLTGKYDKVFYKPDVVAGLLGRIPDTREVVFEDLGHLIPVEDGKRTAEALIDFGGGL